MPVTKTAKRALRVSKRKQSTNSKFMDSLEIALRIAKKSGTEKSKRKAQSLLDRASKIKLFHKNKSARLTSSLLRKSS